MKKARRAAADLVCYVLDETTFETLKAEHPLVAVKLLTDIGREPATASGGRPRRCTS